MAEIDLTPTEEMAANAARGLELRRKHGKGGTEIGVARARDISNRKNLSPETVRRMHAFFSRHEKNKAGGEDDAGYIAWLLWGGDSGQSWAKRKVEQMDKGENQRSDTYKEIAQRLGSAAKMARPVVVDTWNAGHAVVTAELMPDHVGPSGVMPGAMWTGAITAKDRNGSIDRIAFTNPYKNMENAKRALMAEIAKIKASDMWRPRSKNDRPGAKAKMANHIRTVAEDKEASRRGLRVMIDQLESEWQSLNNQPSKAGRIPRMETIKKQIAGLEDRLKSLSSRPGAKAKFAVSREVTESLKFHTSKMNDLLRQFRSMSRKAFGDRFDPAWLAEHVAEIEAGMSALNAGRIKEATSKMRAWADEFTSTYLQHAHTRDLAMLARAIAREPAHVMEVAQASGVRASRPGAKAKFAKFNEGDTVVVPYGREMVRGKIVRYDAPGMFYVVDIGKYESIKVAKEDVRKASMSRPGAKAKFAAQVSGSSFITDDGKKFNISRWMNLSNASNAVQETVKRAAIVTDEKGKEWELKIYQNGSFVLRSPTAGGKRIEGKVASSRPGAKVANAVREGEKVSASDDAVSRKIRKLMDEGKPQKQAVAIALDLERRGEL